MNINNSNNNDDDDEDEFAHLSFDPTTNDIDDSNDAVLELQMTMVALQTEHDILLQKIQQQNKQQVRLLQDEIRQLQNEINVLSAVAHPKSRPSAHNNNNNNTVSSKRPLPPPGANLSARSNAILFPTTTTTASFEKEVSRSSQPPQRTNGETSGGTIPDPPSVPHYHSPPRQSPHSTTNTSEAQWWWMNHFLRQQLHHHDPIILQRLMIPFRSGSEWEVLHWFLVEIVTEQQHQEQQHKRTITTYLQSLWQCFHEVLSCCLPQSYRPIQMGLLESPPDDACNNHSLTIESTTNDPMMMRQLPRRRQRPKGPRTTSITAYRRSSEETTASLSEPALYTSVEQHLSHPLLVSSFSSSRPLPSAENLHHSYDVQRFIQNGLYHWYDLGRLVLLQRQQTLDQRSSERSSDHMTDEEDDNNDTSGSGDVTISQLSSISILAMQITGLLVSNSRESIRPPPPSSASFCFPDNCCDSLLNNILNIGQSIVRHPPRSRKKDVGMQNRGDQTKHHRNRHHHTKHATHPSSSHVVSPPFRLVHVEYMEQQQQQQLDQPPVDRPDVNPANQTLFAHFNENNALSWMAEALNLLQMLIWTKPNYHSSLSPRELVWIKTKRTAALMGILLDVLEYTILPNISLYTHPFTITCVRWIQGLIEKPLVQLSTSSEAISTNADLGFYDDDTDDVKNNISTGSSSHGSNNYTTNSNYYYWRLVRTQNVTTDSTAELWHTSPTAINLLLQMFTRIVLQQMSHDHIPSEAVDVIPLLPLRDAIIRFMHCILLQVQKDRQLWEQQHYRMKQGAATASASNNNKVTTKKRMRPILSFIIILSDQMEIYKSMITVLLSSNNPASVANCDNGITNSLYCLHDDLYAMLQLQLEEITDDQYEKLQHG